MKKWFVVSLVFVGLTLFGCSDSDNGIAGQKPPEAVIEIGSKSYDTILGSYCWGENGQTTCVDTAGPQELLKGVEPIKVKAGVKIFFVMNDEPQPNESYVLQISESDEIEVSVQENSFRAPLQQGIYYYSYGVWWMDEQEENVSNGDAFYNFVLEVE